MLPVAFMISGRESTPTLAPESSGLISRIRVRIGLADGFGHFPGRLAAAENAVLNDLGEFSGHWGLLRLILSEKL